MSSEIVKSIIVKSIIVKATPEQEAQITKARKLLPGTNIPSASDAILAIVGLFATQVAKGTAPVVHAEHFKRTKGTKDERKSIALRCTETDGNRLNNVRRAWPGSDIPSVNEVCVALVDAYVKAVESPQPPCA